MDPDLVSRLVDGDGARLLAELDGYREQDAFAAASRLRAAGHDTDLVAAVLAQARLRARATGAFGGQAGGMLFTSDGLEQATRPQLAARHAQRYHLAGIRQVHDLTCGIGADARAFAAAGLLVCAYDADPVTAAIAAANLRPWPAATVRVGRAEQVARDAAGRPDAGAWLDPGRRRTGVADVQGRTRRVFSLQQMSPSWDTVLRVAAEVPATGVKLSPSFSPAAAPSHAEAQWTSWRGEVLECAVWWGPLARVRGRSAAVCRPAGAAPPGTAAGGTPAGGTHAGGTPAGGTPEVTVTEADAPPSGAPLASLEGLGGWLYEADPALVAARLTGAAVAATGGVELSDGIGLVSADREVQLPFARRYAVLEAMPLHVKAVRAWLREHGIGRVTVKKRGSAVDPERLREQLRTKASGSALLLVTSVAGDSVVLVLRP